MIRDVIKITLALSKCLLDKKGIIIGMSRLVAKNQLIKHSIYYQWTGRVIKESVKMFHDQNIHASFSEMERENKKKKKEIKEITLFQSHVLTNTAD